MLEIASYVCADSLQDALAVLQQPKQYTVLAGGTDIVPRVREGMIQDAHILDIGVLRNELGNIWVDDTYLHMGALCRHCDIEKSSIIKRWCSALADSCAIVGATQIRNRGTLGGNIVNASPAADTLPVLVATEAKVVLQSSRGKRTLSVADFVVGPGKTKLQKNELLVEILLPISGNAWTGTFTKVGSRNALAIAVASVAVLQHTAFGLRIACGSVGPTVRRAMHVETIYQRKQASRQEIDGALALDISPIDDIRATGHYRRQVVCDLLFNGYIKAT